MTAIHNPERATIARAVDILGVPERTVQALASRGEIPGAAKIGRRWTFDITLLRSYVAHKVRLSCQSEKRPRTHIGAAVSSGRGSRSRVPSNDLAYEQAMKRLRSQGSNQQKLGK
jgi:hypothetical protein